MFHKRSNNIFSSEVLNKAEMHAHHGELVSNTQTNKKKQPKKNDYVI